MVLKNRNGITIRELKEWLSSIKDVDEYGEEREVWMSTGWCESSPVTEVWPLNVSPDGSSDIIFESPLDNEPEAEV